MPLRRAIAALLVISLSLLTGGAAATAGPLSGGNSLYLVEGEETSFTFDPLVLKDGLLLADEVFRALGITVSLKGNRLEASRAPVRATLTIGSTSAQVDGRTLTPVPAPVHIGEHVFLPLALMREFGVDVTLDGALVTIHDMARGLTIPEGLDDAAFLALWRRNTLNTQVKTDDGKPFLDAEVTLLTPDLVASSAFAATYGQRVEFLSHLQSGTLLLVKVTNRTGRPATLRPSSLSLVDEVAAEQYDVIRTLSYRGWIDQRIASGAARASVLVYPSLPESVRSVTVFSDTNPGALGTFNVK